MNMKSPSTSTPDHRANPSNFQKSHFLRTVCLADWWLVKSENEVQGRRLAVGGLTDQGNQARREFTSAPILKSYDDFNIETTDGICVVLKGFINKDRTLEHGFPSDVFNHFVFGFPLYWKEYDENVLCKQPPSKEIVTDKFSEQLSQGLRYCEKIRFNSISSVGFEEVESELVVDKEPVSSNNRNSEDKGIREIKTRSSSCKAKTKATELPSTPAVSLKSHDSDRTPASADNHRGNLTNGKSSLSEKAKDLGKATRQNSMPVSKETPKRENKKEKGWNASPQSCSFRRSRSGRLLMPTLEFWRNQRAIYDTDRTVTGFEEGMQPYQLRNGT
ncbi:kinetochore-associated protein KNL-2 homolog isoform X1 [Salvia hispanica]|uniref:kinetochore-associated protein KNL-2 homolog isoform X1 n=1 Tax=Salvia hispanica TaxID=49212 RepID=UPI0020091A2C|nr:kinetochore-associated protein KNL-2 homolog isoform X1 [Salvia hispanica]